MTPELYDITALKIISGYFIKTNESIAVAESVTSGHLQAALSSAENASVFFQGGLTAYNLMQKYKHLHIDITTAITCNCVSAIISEEMAINGSKLFSSHWGIGVTGYASPLPEEGIVDLFAYYTITFKETIIKQEIVYAPKADPILIQLHYTNHILRSIAHEIEIQP
ncbi:CinA family protein [Ferruginibacter albus]|uniref:CinA family protein n=1 Tax=Ferruginibacter albus TaxID=2875540 RepID=UPI001CC44159|nr:CinA family protein [Ferruginibacter albus]UAY53075.1 CinA family protein [Ferruginibacter albus]